MARDSGCNRLEYHLRPINRIDQRGDRTVATARDWIVRIFIGLLVGLVGGMAGHVFGDVVGGAVRESRLEAVETEHVVAREDRAGLHQEIADIRAAVMGSLGRIEGQLEGLQRAVDKLR